MSILLIYAHPYPARSVANRVLLDAVRDVPGLTRHALYDAYPDFAIDVQAERERLAAAKLIIWQHPLYWYHVPALLALWFEVVLTRGWAYGADEREGGRALAGKHCLWVTTTGAAEDGYREEGIHGHRFAEFIPPVRQTAVFCHLQWHEPIVVHGAHRLTSEALREHAQLYRQRLLQWSAQHG